MPTMYLLTLILLPALIATATPSCPPSCLCSDSGEVNCLAISLTRVPTWDDDDIDDVITMDLSLNDIAQLEPDAFLGLDKLETILINYNQIKDVDTFAFSELRNLKVLELENNAISSLDRNTFVPNPSLETLSLSGNPLKLTPRFLYSETITSLDLSRCGLESLPHDVFAGLTQLETLILSHNSLDHLPVDILDNLPNLKRIYLHGNPFSCGGYLEELVESRKDLVADYKKINCVPVEPVKVARLQEIKTTQRHSYTGLWVREALVTSSRDGADVSSGDIKIVVGPGEDSDVVKEVEDELVVRVVVIFNIALICAVLLTVLIVGVLLRKNILECVQRRKSSSHERLNQTDDGLHEIVLDGENKSMEC